MHSLITTMCGLAAAALAGIGLFALFAPGRLARSYGVPVDHGASRAFVRTTGVRDAVIGALLAFGVLTRDARLLQVIAISGLAISLADLTIAWQFAHGFRRAHLAHLGGAVGFAVIIALLRASVP